MPILKQLVSSSSQSKRRSRADLTPEMISAPLGDFRHTMHVGRGGDTFGDTSFLSSRSGEPPRQPSADPYYHHAATLQQPPQPPPPESPSHKPSLLSRTFRSSKRSQSVNRADKHKTSSASSITVASMMPGGSSPTHVKSAISMPYLNEAGGGGVSMSKSVSSSPLKKLPGGGDGDAVDGWKPANGAAATAASGGVTLASLEPDLLESERRFGELSDLPPSLPRGAVGGMKHAESIMSFHIDLGPSMLGDILSVMDKPGWEEDDLGYEEGRALSPLSPPEDNGDHDNDEGDHDDTPSPAPPSRPPRTSSAAPNPYTPELRSAGVTRPSNNHHHMDSCSVSSSGSTVQEDRMSTHGGLYHRHNQSETDGDSARFSSPGRTRDEDRDFSFMDDEEDEDEIRV
ncbi:LOW QUALITY PROTEIN: cdc42 effector protein 4 [Alosa alosa]|uniref:LOW QUALITY PROTEIN: cdc42 effector protein 4 n=1 Tax=Alosa alosa TaxID=278164 RepID=UPI0020153302|nr:LOW QUALITY PROTEIN: cdc42 effector protein 4 [Alosa alosa]